MKLRKALNTIPVLLFAFAVSSEMPAQMKAAPAVYPPSAYVTNADIQAAIAAKTAAMAKRGPLNTSGTYDVLVKKVDAGSYIVVIAYLHRTKAEVKALAHPRVTEVYQMLTGSGDFETGGSLMNASPIDLTSEGDDISLSGTLQGGQTRHIGPGDAVTILPGVPHRFIKLDSTVTYLVTRIEEKGQN